MHAHNSLVGVILSERMRAYQVNVTHIRRDERTGARDRKAPSAHDAQTERERERETMGEGKKREKIAEIEIRNKSSRRSFVLERKTTDKWETRELGRWWKQAPHQLRWLYRWPIPRMISKSKTKDLLVKLSPLEKHQCFAKHSREKKCAQQRMTSIVTELLVENRRKPNAQCDYLSGRGWKWVSPVVDGEWLKWKSAEAHERWWCDAQESSSEWRHDDMLVKAGQISLVDND